MANNLVQHMDSMTSLTDRASSAAKASVWASAYTRIIGSVFDLRRCTQLSAKSIFTPSISVMRSPAYFALGQQGKEESHAH